MRKTPEPTVDSMRQHLLYPSYRRRSLERREGVKSSLPTHILLFPASRAKKSTEALLRGKEEVRRLLHTTTRRRLDLVYALVKSHRFIYCCLRLSSEDAGRQYHEKELGIGPGPEQTLDKDAVSTQLPM